MNVLSLPRSVLLSLCLYLIPAVASAQATSPQSRIVESVNESVLITLRGNTHPLAQPQFDRGPAPPDLPMARMLLVLKRSAAQELALGKLLDDQQDQISPRYHQWLSPDEFGRQFGPSDQDIQAITAWLRSHGFQTGPPSRGRTVIEFSGTASQVQQAFHTEMHKYAVNGGEHWANASDPQIPVALSPVVEGVASIHNFPKLPMHRIAGRFSQDRTTGQVKSLEPDFTNVDMSLCHLTGSGYCYFVGPYDFAKIYNVLPLWNAAIDGTGQSIAIVSESNINLQDVRDFRQLFGLPPNDPQIFLNGPDPGIVQGPETEALLDVEWSGAVAKGATIKLVVSPPTNSTEGADLAGLYAVENNLAPIVSESYGDCELYLGAAGNSFESAIRQQAAAQGITFINSSGDEGSARCDPTFSSTNPSPATHGLVVSGLASTPYGVAVGGTDFLNFGSNYKFHSPSPYWNTTNDSHQTSAIGYVPETTWNENCTNPVFVFLAYGSSPEAACNNSQISDRVETIASGGGKSSCTISDQTNTNFCMGGYPKPSWQSAPGVPNDGARDIPDVSLFASAGFMDSSYIVCESDQLPAAQSCALTTPYVTFLGVGGTSAAAPSFAGIMALVNQYTHSSGQGNANYVLYRLASTALQTSNNCDASSSPSSKCIFYDVTSGANTVPCYEGSFDCNPSIVGDIYGVLPGYSAGAGYDLATGLGSVNAYNLVHSWTMPSNPSTVTLSLTPTTLTHGQSVSYNIAVTPSAATGLASLIGKPTGSGSDGMASFTLQSGAASGTTTALAGGNAYKVTAHYAGDSAYAASDSTPVTVTVTPEPSKPVIWISNQTNPIVFANPTSVPYGSTITGYAGVGNSQATATIPPQPACAPLTCPTGAVTISDSLNAGLPTILNSSGEFPLNVQGISQVFTYVPSGGQHVITANYPGDNSYSPGSGIYNLTVTPAGTIMFYTSPSAMLVGSTFTIFTEVAAVINGGIAPTGTITFSDGTSPIPGMVTYSSTAGSPTSFGTLSGSITHTLTTSGTHNISMSYSGDANYAADTNVMIVPVVNPTTMTEQFSSTTIDVGQSVTVTAVAKSSYKTPPMTGNFQIRGDPYFPDPGPLTPTISLDASGNQVLTATATVMPTGYLGQTIIANYFGDSNFASATATVSINVNPPDFTLATGSPSLTINAGQTGSTTLTITPKSNNASNVSLFCDATPIPGAACSFNPTSNLSLNGVALSTTFVVTTLPPSTGPSTSFIAIRFPQNKHVPPTPWVLLGVADGIAIVILSLSSGQRRSRLAASLGLACLVALTVSCGGGGGYGVGVPPGPSTSTLTISTSGVKVQSGSNVVFTVKVNSATPATGTVTLFDAGNLLATVNVVIGTGSVALGSLTVGTHVITANYSGDSNNLPSSTIGGINQVIAGTTEINLQAVTGTLTHTLLVSVAIQ
jgi:hypothetical protein